jgi:ferredoxin
MVEPSGSVTVDAEMCSGSGLCLSIAPEVFSMPAGQAHANAVEGAIEGEQLDLAREAESLCPLGAIRVEPIAG